MKKKQLILIILLIAGLIVTVYLVQVRKIFYSKAGLDLPQAFQITQTKDGTEDQVNCDASGCTTQSLDIKIKIKDLERLME